LTGLAGCSGRVPPPLSTSCASQTRLLFTPFAPPCSTHPSRAAACARAGERQSEAGECAGGQGRGSRQYIDECSTGRTEETRQP
jgi:hypothetical protein